MKRYHPALVALHWLLAVVVIFVLLLGGDIALKIHLLLGVLIGGLFILRFFIKLFSTHPSDVDSNRQLNRLARIAHNIIYGIVFAVVASGVGIALEAGLLEVIQNNGILPDNFSELVILNIHVLLTKILLVIIAAHILAAFIHQFVFMNALFSRMWFGKR